ncbi:hypothetical protein AAMO2058_000172900 [Amorphochlora amoebiformis]
MIASSTSPKIKILEHQEDAVTDLSPEKGLPNLLSGGKDEDEDEDNWSHAMAVLACDIVAIILSVGVFTSSLVAKRGWHELKTNPSRSKYEFEDIEDFLLATEICILFGIIANFGHFLSTTSVLFGKLGLREAMFSGVIVHGYSFVYSVVLLSTTIDFLKSIEKSKVGYCSSGAPRNTNPGCVDLFLGFHWIRGLSLACITVNCVLAVVYSDLLCKADLEAIPDYGMAPPDDLPPLPAEDEDKLFESLSSPFFDIAPADSPQRPPLPQSMEFGGV